MFATGDTETCIRRKSCDPIGGKSLYGSFSPISETQEKILLINSADSNSFFHDISISTDADISGMVANLLVAESIRRGLSEEERIGLKRQIIFAMFDAESWGYVGMLFAFLPNLFSELFF